jgi:peptidoglycan/xylan/chitin deacetylase (PgdA/CDA1 family)
LAEAQSQGHELGNYSVSHEHAADLTKASEELQVEDAKKFLDSNLQSDILMLITLRATPNSPPRLSNLLLGRGGE